jgi:hypothetical protein
MMLLNFDRIILHLNWSILNYHCLINFGNAVGIFSHCSFGCWKTNRFPKSSNQNKVKIGYTMYKQMFSTSKIRHRKVITSRSKAVSQL